MLTSRARRSSSESQSSKPGQQMTGKKRPPLLTTPIPAGLIERVRPVLFAFFTDTVSRLEERQLEQFLHAFQEWPKLDSAIFNSPARTLFPGRAQTSRVFFKRLIEKMESLKIEPSDQLYECLCQAMATEEEHATHFYRIFPLDYEQFSTVKADNFLLFQEAIHQISRGTTGLSCWQASYVLSDFLHLPTTASKLAGRKCALELGAGCGLAGIALAKLMASSGGTTCIVLSDFGEPVLQQLRTNVALNFANQNAAHDGPNVEVLALDWTNYKLEDLPAADLIIAADVVYDPALFPALVGLLRHLLVRNSAIALFACTVRDPGTLDAFLKCAADHGIATSAQWEHCICPSFSGNGQLQHQFLQIPKKDEPSDQQHHELGFEPLFCPPPVPTKFAQADPFKTLIFEFVI